MKRGAASNLSFVEPMMVLWVRDLRVGNWLYELKFDDHRALSFKAGKEVRLVSRSERISTVSRALIKLCAVHGDSPFPYANNT